MLFEAYHASLVIRPPKTGFKSSNTSLSSMSQLRGGREERRRKKARREGRMEITVGRMGMKMERKAYTVEPLITVTPQ